MNSLEYYFCSKKCYIKTFFIFEDLSPLEKTKAQRDLAITKLLKIEREHGKKSEKYETQLKYVNAKQMQVKRLLQTQIRMQSNAWDERDDGIQNCTKWLNMEI